MKLVIFDIDGTLVDSGHMICAAVHRAYDDHGLPRPERARVLSIVGLSLPDAFATLAAGAAHPIEALVRSYSQAFSALRESLPVEALYPGARETVLALSARPDVALGIATGKSTRGVERVLGAHGLLKHFVTVQTADTAPSKPDPGMVFNALRATAVEPGSATVIGDSVYDMQMAKAAGATAIGVGWGYNPPERLRAAGADLIVDDFAALIPALDRLGAVDA
jgi:phosphoglycolate phosphatase